jgi:hypothetical protein
MARNNLSNVRIRKELNRFTAFSWIVALDDSRSRWNADQADDVRITKRVMGERFYEEGDEEEEHGFKLSDLMI